MYLCVLEKMTTLRACVGVNFEKAKFLLVDIPLFSKIHDEYNAYAW